jgi:ATP-dependent DNA helicase RecG
MTRLPADTRLDTLDWVARPRLAALARLGLLTVGDLVRHFPRRYEDRTRFDRFPDEASDSPLCLFGIVEKTSYRRFGPRRIFEARIVDESAGVLGSPLICRWFNMPWVKNLILSGDRIVLFGRTRVRGKLVVMEHPEFETIEDDAERLVHFDRITPIHPAGDGITPRALRTLIHRAIETCEPPPVLWRGGKIPDDVWRKIHFPDSATELDEAKAALIREEFFCVQLVVCSRHAGAARAPGTPRTGGGALWQKVHKSLPYRLTASQEDVMREISADLSAPRRMNRLLQGDVGSGKTIVALRAMLEVAEAGWQAALMAPTQILAEQHYLNFRRLLDPHGIPVALRTASRREGNSSTPESTLPGLADDSARIIIGTHALLFDGTAFDRLGLVVIDEQHKFGVLQRSRLITRGDAPDVLVMTATPIPRTITQTLYGDLDLSIIREKPAGRGSIVTAVRPASKLPDIIAFLRKELADGRQAYIVYPLIEESDKLAAKAATVESEKWRNLLAPATVGLVHGRMDPAAKEDTMRRFRDGSLACLVATTVIEVGVDVPNASIMLIENAGRFGLSQIHQLRGRIGRGSAKSYCILLDDDPSENAAAKLAVLKSTSDGFEIAEADLRLRGPGDILGTAQTGLPPLQLGDLLRDGDLMTDARHAALQVFETDPDLNLPAHAPLKSFLANPRWTTTPTEG